MGDGMVKSGTASGRVQETIKVDPDQLREALSLQHRPGPAEIVGICK